MNQPYLALPGLICKKTGENLFIWPIKSILFLIKTSFRIKNILILIALEFSFYVKSSDFKYNQWFLSFTLKCVNKWQKSGFTRDSNFETIQKFLFKIWYNFKTHQNFVKLSSSSKSVTAGSGRARLGRFITDIDK